MKEGVPMEAMGRLEKVQATRVVGQGYSFLRKASIDSIFQVAASLPEDGRNNLIADKIAAEAGQAAVQRYFPQAKDKLPDEQVAEASQWVGLAKIGVPPVVTSSQNPVVFAHTFLAACVVAVQSLQQGAQPEDVLKFLDVLGPGIMAHLQRIQNDPTRQQVYQAMLQQWQQLAQITDRLKAMAGKVAAQRKAQQEKTAGAMTDEQLKQVKLASDIKNKEQKTEAQLRQSQEKHALKMAQGTQELTLADATTAAEIHRQRLKAEAEVANAGKSNGE
jgi:hypothetical protein